MKAKLLLWRTLSPGELPVFSVTKQSGGGVFSGKKTCIRKYSNDGRGRGGRGSFQSRPEGRDETEGDEKEKII